MSGVTTVPPTVADPAGKVLEGRDGWLFLTNDTNDVIGQTTGSVNLGERGVRSYRRALDYRRAWLAERGTTYLYIVVPNKESLYAEHLPAGVTLSEDRWVRRVESAIAERGPRRVFHYLFEALATRKGEADLFARTDNHWNDVAAYFACLTIAGLVEQALGIPLPSLGPERIVVAEAFETGDLGAKLARAVQSRTLRARPRSPGAELLHDNRIRNRGRTRTWEHPGNIAAGGPRAVVFHDSFFDQLGPFVAESFARVHATHQAALDFDIVEREQPDVVLTIAVERMAIRMPNDPGAPTTAETVARKQAEGGWAVDDGAGAGARVYPAASRPAVASSERLKRGAGRWTPDDAPSG